jgi:hypothetical protein
MKNLMAVGSLPLRLYCVVLALTIAGLVAYLAATQPGVPILAGVLFAALIVYSNHRSVEFSQGTVVNADFMLMMAAIVVFHDSSPYLGPLLVALARGLYWPQLRDRDWGLVVLNAGSGGMGILVGAIVVHALGDPTASTVPVALLTAAAAAVSCVFALWLTLVPIFLDRGQSLRFIVGTFAPRAIESLPFSLLGYFLGRLYVSIGPSAMLMLVVPMFIAREMFASYLRVKQSHDETVQVLVAALEQKDRYTAGHAERVAKYAQYMGEQLDFMPARLERLRFAALMHDIGKLVVPNHLLNKPGKLTEDEFARIRVHEKVSVQMLSHIDFLRPIASATHSDAMRFDADDPNHPIEPYIIMIADAYDAMTSTRAYRKALPQHVAFKELRDKSGTQFHPRCVEAFIAAIEAREEVHGAGHEEASEFEDAPEVGLGSAGLGDLLKSEAG